MQTLRRRYQQQTPYGRVLGFERIAFYHRQLRLLQQSLDVVDKPCSKALRNIVDKLLDIVKNLERYRSCVTLPHV